MVKIGVIFMLFSNPTCHFRDTAIFLLLINEEFVIRVISYFGGSCFATPPVKGLLQSWLFGRDFWGISRKGKRITSSGQKYLGITSYPSMNLTDRIRGHIE